MIYTILFLIGLIGLGAMLLIGMGHGAGHSGGHIGHDSGHGGHLGHDAHGHAGHGHDGHGHGHDSQGEESRGSTGFFWQLLSPVTLMSLCMGAGATGLILRDRHLPEAMSALAASIGAVAFYGLVVKPMSTFIFKFASKPSLALEGTTAKTAEAAGKFDQSGRGIVTLNVDGQLVRVLAELEQDDRSTFDMIKPGEQLTVTAVDGRRNTCRVARM